MDVDVVGVELPVGVRRRIGAGQARRVSVVVVGKVFDTQSLGLLLIKLVGLRRVIGEGGGADGVGDELAVADNVAVAVVSPTLGTVNLACPARDTAERVVPDLRGRDDVRARRIDGPGHRRGPARRIVGVVVAVVQVVGDPAGSTGREVRQRAVGVILRALLHLVGGRVAVQGDGEGQVILVVAEGAAVGAGPAQVLANPPWPIW